MKGNYQLLNVMKNIIDFLPASLCFCYENSLQQYHIIHVNNIQMMYVDS